MREGANGYFNAARGNVCHHSADIIYIISAVEAFFYRKLIVADSHMAMVLPDDIAGRVADFMSGKTGFPFIGRDEPMCLMYLYGRMAGVKPEEVDEATDLAQRTVGQMAIDIDGYANSSAGKLDSEYIRSKYINRQLQLAVENKTKRFTGDPAVLSDCFAQHVVHYRQDYFFGLYGPLKEAELIAEIRPALAGRMVMVCYNRKSEQELSGGGGSGSSHPLIPVYMWFKEK